MAEWTRVEVPAAWEHATKPWGTMSATWDSVIGGYSYNVICSEECRVADRVAKSQSHILADSMGISSTYTDYRQFVLRVMEAIKAEDIAHRQFYATRSDEFHISDKPIKDVQLYDSELLSLLDGMTDTKHISRRFQELVKAGDTVHKTSIKGLAENISAEDNIVKQAAIAKEAFIGIETEFADKRTVLRQFLTAIGVSDSVAKQAVKIPHEAVKVLDEQLRNSNAVISDIIISTNDIKRDVPAGYSDWMPFVSGDYTYKEALVRSVLSVTSPDNKSVLSAFCIKVDLPDLQDHGVVEMEAKEVKVPFTLDFYRVPEVTVSMVSSSGVSAIPNITEVTEKYFKLKLLDTAGEVVSGKASWTAVGC